MKTSTARKDHATHEEGEVLGTRGGNPVVGLIIPPADLRIAQFKCVGTAPYVQNKFSSEQKSGIKRQQEAGGPGKNKRKRDPKDFNKIFEGAKHTSEDGWLGIPASAFRAALISACRVANFKMTLAKLSIFVVGDGLDAEEGTPLVRINGDVELHESVGRNQTGVVDIRVRPMWRKWDCVLNVRFDAGQFTAADVLNLLSRAGAQVGIGEGRPDSRNSIGMGWGTFEVESVGNEGPAGGVTPLRKRARR